MGEPNKTRNVLRELLTNQSKCFRPVPDQWKQEAGFLGRVHNVSNQICHPCRLEYEKERLSLPRTPTSAEVLAAPAPISCASADAALDIDASGEDNEAQAMDVEMQKLGLLCAAQ